MNILLLNAHSSRNAGDLAILHETLACLRQAFPHATITATINDPDLTALPADVTYVDSLLNWLIDVNPSTTWRWRKWMAPVYAVWLLLAIALFRLAGLRLLPKAAQRRRLMRAYYTADLAVVIGGGHLYGRHALNITFYWLWFGLAMAVLLGKPIIFLPQSYGPVAGPVQRWMLRWLLDRNALAATREWHSFQLLASTGVRQRVLVLPDLAFTSAFAPVEAANTVLERYNAAPSPQRPLVGMTLMDWQRLNPLFRNQAGYEAAMLALIRHVHRRYNAHVVLFAQSSGPVDPQDDRRIARRIAAASQAAHVSVVDEVLSPQLLKAAYGRLEALVATRMHSAIFALSSGVPSLLIGYTYKSAGMTAMLGLARHVLPIDTIDAEQLCAAFDRLWAEREIVRTQLAQRIPAVQSTLHHLPTLIRQSIQEP
ncbi:MAG: polysaccharide pyruvyl transferase family protein [Chloroflexales bacterium]|nr:polysaccharide pyruvyl transferase family protein [Chloroflexales bacterium]